MDLTPEQRAIIEHGTGPALVFAVAGSGKTTTVAYRIDRLVRSAVFEPKKILATSFNKAAVGEIQKKLDQVNFGLAKRVTAKSLHALGYSVVQEAINQEYLLNAEFKEDALEVLSETVKAARQTPSLKQLLDNIDREDFMAYLSDCKGNLRYADLQKAELPPQALKVATQASAPANLPWYLDLYRRFEAVRASRRWITYDDMLMSGWECLVRYPDLLRDFRNRYQCVIVDEFQDINLAQSEMVHEIVCEHLNYMAVGDDDQTIYEWRGASPRFILDFAKRYSAKKFIISDNFRSPISPVVLAAEVIRHNKNREPKHLSPTKGFTGKVLSHGCADSTQIATDMVNEICHLEDGDVNLKDMVILVRTFSQTTAFEPVLVARKIPYVIVGNLPFYRRREIVALINYLRLAVLEATLTRGEGLSSEAAMDLRAWWGSVYNYPTRYLSREAADHVRKRVVTEGVSLTRAALLASEEHAFQRFSDPLLQLSALIETIAKQLDEPAVNVLRELDRRLGYQEFLRSNSAFQESANAKVEGVKAFFRYAEDKGNVRQLLAEMEKLSSGAIEEGQEDPDLTGKLRVTTIYRAKGGQWKHVFVPNCDDGTILLATSDNIEEERRLLYVALTRPLENVHVFWTKPHPSAFLREADLDTVLHDLEHFEKVTRSADSYHPEADVAHQVAKRFSLRRYLERWWSGDKSLAASIMKGMERVTLPLRPATRPLTPLEKDNEQRLYQQSRMRELEQRLLEYGLRDPQYPFNRSNDGRSRPGNRAAEYQLSRSVRVVGKQGSTPATGHATKTPEIAIPLPLSGSCEIPCRCGAKLGFTVQIDSGSKPTRYDAGANCFLETYKTKRQDQRNLICRHCGGTTALPPLAHQVATR
jgi:DNA helicase-2/ATP-dependent DNA helicase PcrA